jgi:CRISPR-associated protein (TIGR03986 family)
MLCYARLGHDPSSGARTVAALYPVTISRDHHQSAPDELLPESFKPARSIDQLSPAERVFGWVAPHRLPPGEPGAYRGNIRIGYVESCSANPIEHQADPGFPLAILSAPKPQQARFYVACDEVGHAQAHGLDRRRAGYIADGQKHLRGRKVYPHHRDTPSPPAEVRSAGDLRDLAADGLLASRARYPEEARRAGGLRDGQNRSIGSWIARDKVFRFSIDVKNLSDEELGALLWLLDLRSARHPDAVHCHRLAGGKPLGFGSVRIAIERTALRTGRQWRAHYRDLAGPGPTATPGELATCEERFKEAVRSAGRAASFEDVPHITALLKAARGYDDGSPILYPRPSAKPDPDGRNYVWFVGNDARPKWSLPDLDGDDDRLPTLDKWGNATE